MKSCLKSVASRFNRKCHKNGLRAVSKCFNRRSNDSFLGKTFDETVYALETREKRHKRGECADSSNSFVCDLDVYTQENNNGNPEQGLGYRVVHNLTRRLVGKNHHVFIDNFFNSTKLAEDLI